MGKISTKTERLPDFVSELYFNEKGKFYQVFYRWPKNKKILWAHIGYVLPRVLIIASFLATIHNLCQFYDMPFYNTFRSIVKRPLFVIYGLIGFSFIFFSRRLWQKEYEIAKTNLNPSIPIHSHF